MSNISGCHINASQALVFSMYTYVYSFKLYWHKLGRRNMLAKQGIDK